MEKLMSFKSPLNAVISESQQAQQKHRLDPETKTK